MRGAIWMKADPYIQNKRYNISCEKAFSKQKGTPSLIFLKDFAHFKNVCFNNTSAFSQSKAKIGNYNTNSFLSSCSLLKYLYVLLLNFIAKEQFISQKAYVTEGLSSMRPMVKWLWEKDTF